MRSEVTIAVYESSNHVAYPNAVFRDLTDVTDRYSLVFYSIGEVIAEAAIDVCLVFSVAAQVHSHSRRRLVDKLLQLLHDIPKGR